MNPKTLSAISLDAIKSIFHDAVRTSLDLFKIMIPIIIGVKIFKELGLIEYLALPLSPLMELCGLPAQTGLVWAAAIANTLYSAIIVYLALIPDMPTLTVAQVTVMCVMMLIAHNLPVETQITKKCGINPWGQAFIRFFGALACGMLLNLVFSHGGLLTEPSRAAFTAEARELGIGEWAFKEVRQLGWIFCIILALLTLMRVLRFLRITNLLIFMLGPILRLLGIGREAGTLTIIGLTMGIGYGGGLIIHEAKSGRLRQRDIFASLTLMGLSHALIEDSLLMLLLGASLQGVLWGRLLFSLAVTALLSRLYILWESRVKSPDQA
ncbi:MAG: hypothetical protein V1816_18735 [Pseudomonadota bacterium]